MVNTIVKNHFEVDLNFHPIRVIRFRNSDPTISVTSVYNQESTPLCLRKTHGTRTLSVWLSWFGNVWQYTEVAESNVLEYIVKPTWPYLESKSAVRFTHAEWCAFYAWLWNEFGISALLFWHTDVHTIFV